MAATSPFPRPSQPEPGPGGLVNPTGSQAIGATGEGWKIVELHPGKGGMKEEDRRHAAARLMCDQHPDPLVAGERFLGAAELLGMDTRLLWGAQEQSPAFRSPGRRFAQAILAVPGSGGTAMLFLSPPPSPTGAWRDEVARPKTPELGQAREERALGQRVALIETACGYLASTSPQGLLVQALVDPPAPNRAGAQQVIRAFEHAGFLRLGDLAYLRRPVPLPSRARPAKPAATGGLPAGVRVQSVADLRLGGASGEEIDAWLLAALERSYVDTKDCPELCGLRSPTDVLESHKAVGQLDERLWLIAFDEEGAQGCALLSPNRDGDCVELVYLGLGTRLRGRGLGRRLMEMSIATMEDLLRAGAIPLSMHGGLTCAVDTRNDPAMRLYEGLGFKSFSVRVPLVKRLGV